MPTQVVITVAAQWKRKQWISALGKEKSALGKEKLGRGLSKISPLHKHAYLLLNFIRKG